MINCVEKPLTDARIERDWVVQELFQGHSVDHDTILFSIFWGDFWPRRFFR